MKTQHALPNASGLPRESTVRKSKKAEGMGRLLRKAGYGKKPRGLRR